MAPDRRLEQVCAGPQISKFRDGGGFDQIEERVNRPVFSEKGLVIFIVTPLKP
jgi:hypothetical protein